MKERMHEPTFLPIPAAGAGAPLLGSPTGEPLTARALSVSQEIRERIDRQIGDKAAFTHAFRRQTIGQ